MTVARARGAQARVAGLTESVEHPASSNSEPSARSLRGIAHARAAARRSGGEARGAVAETPEAATLTSRSGQFAEPCPEFASARYVDVVALHN
jgi:hypothetical protein